MKNINKFQINGTDVLLDGVDMTLETNAHSSTPPSSDSVKQTIDDVYLYGIYMDKNDYVGLIYDGTDVASSIGSEYDGYIIKLINIDLIIDGTITSLTIYDEYPTVGSIPIARIGSTSEIKYNAKYINKYLLITIKKSDDKLYFRYVHSDTFQTFTNSSSTKFSNLSEIINTTASVDIPETFSYIDDNNNRHFVEVSGNKNYIYSWREYDMYGNSFMLFKTDSQIRFPYGNPFIDIIVTKNTNNIEHIYFGSYYNDREQTKFGIFFYDEEDNLISGYYVPSNFSLTGIQKINCIQYNNSGVEIVCIVNVDKMHTPQSKLPYKSEIYQKDSFFIPADYIKSTNGLYMNELDNIIQNKRCKTVNIPASETTVLNVEFDKQNDIDNIMVIKESGDYMVYLIYTYGPDDEEPVLYDNNCPFNDIISVKYPDGHNKIIISNPVPSRTTDLVCYVYQLSNLEKEYLNYSKVATEIPVKRNTRDNADSRFTLYIPKEDVDYVLVTKNSGDIENYTIYSCIKNGSSVSELTSLMICNFNEPYYINKTYIPETHNYIYLFSGKYNVSEPLDALVYTYKENSIFNLIFDNLNGINTSIANKNVVLFGDSISEFPYQNKTICDHLKDISGANVYNCAIGGTRLSARSDISTLESIEDNGQAYAVLDIVNMVKYWLLNDYTLIDQSVEYLIENASDDNTIPTTNMKSILPENTDVVIIFGGTNDYTGNSPWGEETSENITDVCGALNYMIKNILTANPAIQIYVFTPIVRYFNNERDEEHWSDNYGTDKKLPELADLIEKQCIRLHTPVNNWYYTLGINQYNFSNYFLDNDGTHPYKAFKYIAEKMLKFIESN